MNKKQKSIKTTKGVIDITVLQEQEKKYKENLEKVQKEIKEIALLNLKNKYKGKFFKKEEKENTIYVECIDILDEGVATGNLCAIRTNVEDEGLMLNKNIKFRLSAFGDEITKEEYIKGIIDITDNLKEELYGSKKAKSKKVK